jgi:hypothetical protein
VNLDRRLLRQLQGVQHFYKQNNLPPMRLPFLQLSGDLEGQAAEVKVSPGNHNSDLNLTAADIDLLARVNPWIMGFMSLEYDSSRNTPYMTGNSKFRLGKGFITLGNLNKTPFYASVGQLYVPFGKYSSFQITAPVTEALGRTKARAFVLAADDKDNTGLYAAGYTFASSLRNNNRINGGADFGWNGHYQQISGQIAAGYLANLADSAGLQDNGGGEGIPYSGLAQSNASEHLHHSVPGLDIHGNVNYRQFSLLGEYVSALKSFSSRDVSFNQHGAKPKALDVEAAYSYHLYNRPGSIALDYGHTEQALALLLPRQRYSVTVNYSFFRNTLASLEFRHDRDYGKSTTAGARDGQDRTFASPYQRVNKVTAQFDVYF